MRPRAIAFTLLLSCAAAPAIAQDSIGQNDEAVSHANDPKSEAAAAMARGDTAEALAKYLRALGTNPRDLEALTGAGRAAVQLDDPETAIAFYARAEEIAPKDGRVKAGLGSAMVRQRNPRAALRFFAEAVSLGVRPADIASDRGLANDLRGETRRAQADYQLALAAHPDPETTRRLALSQAMAGDSAAALVTLDPLLRRQDVPAWRARAFVFAIVGDAAEANRTAALVMPPSQARALAPYLARIGGLKPAEKAAAVHFGYLPAGTLALAAADPAPPPVAAVPTPSATAQAKPERRHRRDRDAAPLVDKFAENTVADKASSPAAAASPAAPPDRVPVVPAATATASSGAPADRNWFPRREARRAQPADRASPDEQAAATPKPSSGAAAEAAPVAAKPVAPPPAADPAPIPTQSASTDVVRVTASVAPVAAAAEPPQPPSPGPAIDTAGATPRPAIDSTETARVEADAKRRADALAAAEARAAEQAKRATEEKTAAAKAKADKLATDKAAKAKAAADAKAAEAKLAAAEKAAQDKADKAEKARTAKLAAGNPERYWVQVAGGARKDDLPKAWATVLAKYPKLLAGRSPWTVHYRFTNRVMIGPFKSDDDAQAFVNRAAKDGYTTFPVKTPAGEVVEKVSAR